MADAHKEFETKMQKTIEVVKSDFASVRAGRANAGVLDKIQVEYYGVPTPLQQVASISSPDPRSLVIQPWDATLLKEIEKAIQNGKVAIRTIRRDAMDQFKAMEKKSEITEDTLKDYEEDLQKLTEKYCKEIDTLVTAKEEELMAV